MSNPYIQETWNHPPHADDRISRAERKTRERYLDFVDSSYQCEIVSYITWSASEKVEHGDGDYHFTIDSKLTRYKIGYGKRTVRTDHCGKEYGVDWEHGLKLPYPLRVDPGDLSPRQYLEEYFEKKRQKFGIEDWQAQVTHVIYKPDLSYLKEMDVVEIILHALEVIPVSMWRRKLPGRGGLDRKVFEFAEDTMVEMEKKAQVVEFVSPLLKKLLLKQEGKGFHILKKE